MAQEAQGVLIIACGALAHEIAALRRANRLAADGCDLPAARAAQSPRANPAGRARTDPCRARDVTDPSSWPTGTAAPGGELDRVLDEEGVERIPGRALLRVLRNRGGIRAAERGRDRHLLSDRLSAAALRAAGDPRSRAGSSPGTCCRPISATTASSSICRRRTFRAPRIARARSRRAWDSSFEYRSTGHGTLGSSLAAAMRRHQGRAPGRCRMGAAEHHFLARHSRAGGRQARPRDRPKCSCRRDFRKRSIAPQCARARAARMLISPTGSAARRGPAAMTSRPKRPPKPRGSRQRYTDEDLERLIRAKGMDELNTHGRWGRRRRLRGLLMYARAPVVGTARARPECFLSRFRDAAWSRMHGAFRAIGYERLERPVAAVEKTVKGLLFDCRMCGQCVLSSTGMSCPMNCPKNLAQRSLRRRARGRSLRSQT